MSGKQPGYPRTAEDDLFLCLFVALGGVVVYAVLAWLFPSFNLWTIRTWYWVARGLR